MIDITSLVLGKPKSDQEEFLNEALKRYSLFKAMDFLGAKAFNSVTGGSDLEDLQKESLKLDIANKRKEMGLPYDDDEYEAAINHRRNLLAAGAGIGLSNIQQAHHLSGRGLSPTYKIARLIEDFEPGIGSSLKSMEGTLHVISPRAGKSATSSIPGLIGKLFKR